jgi:hypothetical protein
MKDKKFDEEKEKIAHTKYMLAQGYLFIEGKWIFVNYSTTGYIGK